MKCSYQPRAAPHHWRGTSKYHMPNYDQTHSQLLQYVFRLTPLFLQWNHVGENHDQELWDILWLPFHNTRRWLIRTWRDSCCGAFYRWISEGRFGHEKMSTHLDWNTEPIRKWFTRLKNFTSVSLNTSFQECCIAPEVLRAPPSLLSVLDISLSYHKFHSHFSSNKPNTALHGCLLSVEGGRCVKHGHDSQEKKAETESTRTVKCHEWVTKHPDGKFSVCSRWRSTKYIE